MILKPIAISMKMNKQTKGFTLLEVLLAVFIFGIVMVTLFGSFNAIFGNVDDVDRRSQQHEMMEITLERINQDLTALYVTQDDLYTPSQENDTFDPYRLWGEKRNVGTDSFSFLRCTSFAHLPFNNNAQKGVAQIIYYIQATGNGQYVLKRSDALYPYESIDDYGFAENTADPVLCRNIRSFDIVYVDDKGEEYESWDSDAEEFGYGTPCAIKIKIGIGKADHILNAGTTVLIPAFRDKKET